MTQKQKSEKVPKKMEATYNKIIALTDEFCQEHLNEEYAQLARQLTAALCRKRPSPLARGRANSWACGVVYALGFVNFLFDKSRDPYLSDAEEIDADGVATKIKIGSLDLAVDEPFGYWFDFGDDWRHQINVTAIKDPAPAGNYPKIIEREGNSPPQYADFD